jgi:PiT family inorganic phosphate transporter
MVTIETGLILLIAVFASLFTAWTIGAGSSGSTPFVPAVGADVMSIMGAGFIVGILGFAGAVLQGSAVTKTIGGELVRGVTLSPLAATIALVVSAGMIAIGIFTGYPIATAFPITGAVVGVGLGLGGDPAWHKYQEILALWILTPPVGFSIAFLVARMLRSDTVPERIAVPGLAALVGVVIANIEFALLGPAGETASIVTVVTNSVSGSPLVVGALTSAIVSGVIAYPVARSTINDPERAMGRFLLALGSLVAFSAGGAKVGLAIGPLLPLVETLRVNIPILAVLTFGGIGLLVGSWMAAPRMIMALSQDYSELGLQRSIAVLVPSFVIAQTAIFYGLPISFNEVFVSAIVGSGYATGQSSVSQSKTSYTVLAWIGAFGFAFALSYGLQTAAIYFR